MYRTAAESTRFPADCIERHENLDPIVACIGSNLLYERSSGFAEGVETAFRRTLTADLLPGASGRVNGRTSKEAYTMNASWEHQRFDDDAIAQAILEYDTCVSDTMFNRYFFIAS